MVSGFFLGSLSEGFRKYNSRNNMLSFMSGEIRDEFQNMQDPTTAVYVIGFPKDSTAKNVQSNDKYRVERTELMVQKINLEDMPQVVKK